MIQEAVGGGDGLGRSALAPEVRRGDGTGESGTKGMGSRGDGACSMKKWWVLALRRVWS
jgi:hypothetical protein